MKFSCTLLAAVLALTLSACSAPASSTPASSVPASAPESSSAQSTAPASSSEKTSSPESSSAIHFDYFYVTESDSSASDLTDASVSAPDLPTPDSDAFTRFEAGLSNLGISFSERVTMDATYVGGEAGYKYKCDGYKIELYQFDPESDAYKKAESEGIVTLDGFGDFSVLAHDGLVLLNNGSLPQEVIDLFNAL
ncbi:hypothetical protein [Gemmiger sp. An194]|uniref:hypothetical protein n=1 Tax=Gemmiger sp. An194 TaxID=1965582 RepID=UPI00117BDB1E|nr:hypothetical protein [Gemmiger sp. An194]